MRLLIYLAMFVFLGIWLCSCGSYRSNMKQEMFIESESGYQRGDSVSFSEKTKKIEYNNVTETIEEVTTIYDISQSVDSVTGKHPILSEMKKTIRRDINKGNQENKSMGINQSTSVNSQNKAMVKAAGEKSKQKDETTVPRQIGMVVLAMLVLLGLFFVIFLFCKRKKSIFAKK